MEEVKRTLSLAKEYSENVYFVYRLALESGSRLSEILKVLKEPEKDICDNGFCYYPLAWTRGQKSVFYVFLLTSSNVGTLKSGFDDIVFNFSKTSETSIPFSIKNRANALYAKRYS